MARPFRTGVVSAMCPSLLFRFRRDNWKISPCLNQAWSRAPKRQGCRPTKCRRKTVFQARKALEKKTPKTVIISHSLATSQGGFKGNQAARGAALADKRLPALAPLRAVFDDPIRQRPLKTYVATGFLRLNPLVLENLFAFRLKLPIEGRVPQQVLRRKRVVHIIRHNRELKSMLARYYSF